MKALFVFVYILVLATQLPHVWYAYNALEQEIPLVAYTSIGAALAFELSTGVFTYRLVQGSRRAWTKRGLGFFIVASMVANAYYYQWLPVVFGYIWPIFATVALPVSLALFAEEFGAQVKTEERAAKKAKKQQGLAIAPIENGIDEGWLGCEVCGRVFAYPSQYETKRKAINALNGHKKAHKNETQVVN